MHKIRRQHFWHLHEVGMGIGIFFTAAILFAMSYYLQQLSEKRAGQGEILGTSYAFLWIAFCAGAYLFGK